MIRLCHLYPELLNLYGEYANLLALKRALEQCGQAVEITPVAVGETVSLADAALVYAGAGTESRIAIAAEKLQPMRKELAAAVADGVPMLFTGSAAELAARTIALPDGKTIECLGLADCDAVRSTGRELGDVLYASKLSEKLLAGFINNSGWLKNVADPLFTAEFGPGGIVDAKGEAIAAEGIRTGSVTATYAIGPILARNPWLKRLYAADILRHKTGNADVSAIADDASDKGYEVTVRELLKRK